MRNYDCIPSSRPANNWLRLLPCFFLPLALQAQSADPRSSSEGSGSEVVLLSPFNVTSPGDDQGYDVVFSSTGTRVASDLIELPYQVNVVTAAFMEDFLADTLEDQFAFVSSFAADEDSTNAYTLRGFRTNFVLRDGFARSGLVSKVTLSRAEVIKGPAAAVYGRTQPGGVINFITKRPEDKPRVQLAVGVGTDGYRRATVSSTGPVFDNGKVGIRYRVDLDYLDEEFDQPGLVTPYLKSKVASTVWDMTFNDRRSRVQVAADVTDTTTLPLTKAPILYQTISTSQGRAGVKSHLGMAYDLADVGYNNLPGMHNDRNLVSVNALLEHQFNEHLNLRVAADYTDRLSEGLRMDQFVNRYDIDTHALVGRQPELSTGGEINKSLQADLTGSFWTGRTEHKLLLTADYFNQDAFTSEWRLDSVSVNDPDLNDSAGDRALEDLPGIFTVITAGGIDPKGRPYIHSSDYDQNLETQGIFASWRMSTFNQKVITLLGGRYEETEYTRDNRVLGTLESFTNEGFTPTLGLNIYLHPQLTFFTNYSESYYPVTRTGFDDNGDRIEGGLPNEEGSGTDIGLKSRLFDGRLIFTATYFTLERKNVPYLVDFPAGTEGAGVSYAYRYSTAGLIEGDGVEFDFTLKPTTTLSFFGSYSYNKTEVKEAGYDINLIGRRWEKVPSHSGALGFRYMPHFDLLKGFSFSGSWRLVGDSVLYNGTAVALGTPPPVNYREGNDGRREILNPTYSTVDFSATYRWFDGKKRGHSVQLNLKNALDDDTFRQSGIPATPRRIVLTYRVTL